MIKAVVMGFARKRAGRDGKPRYTAYYLDIRGQERSAGTFSSKKDANDAWKLAEAAVRAGKQGDPSRGRQTFQAYVLEKWLPYHLLEPGVRSDYAGQIRRRLLPFFGPMKMREIMPEHVRQWVTKKYRLVRRERRGRLAKITALREDGSGKAYEVPTGHSWDDRYFKIPFGYWLDAEPWHTTLSLRGKAALLIALSLQSPFTLPAERAPAWYGISADTLERGLRELTDCGALSRVLKVRKAPLAPAGKTRVAEYERLGTFASAARPTSTIQRLRVVGGAA